MEPTILPALNDIATFQARPTSDTVKRTNRLMDYMYTYPTAVLRYYAGDMQLHIESDAAYLVLPGARSRVAGYFYLRANKHPQKAYPGHFNAPLLVECSALKNVVSSAAEAKCGDLFHNCTTAIGLRNALIGLGHPQNKTPVITDNSTAKSFVHSEMRVKRSKVGTCVLIGCGIELHKTNLTLSGIKAFITWPTTSRSIIPLPIIATSGPIIFCVALK